MREIVAVEYRESDWSSPAALAGRIDRVARACADRELGAVGVAGLLAGRVGGLAGSGRPAMLFGLRAESLEAVVAVGGVLGVRGFTGIYGWTSPSGDGGGRLDPRLLVGHGMVAAFGADRCWLKSSPAELRDAFEETSRKVGPGRPHVWMPGPDRFERAVDGVFVEEAGRRGVDLIWVPGTGINAEGRHRAGPRIVEGRRDEGDDEPEQLARWALGDRVERGRHRVRDWARRPRRWLREITGLR